jgi:hypothetical protein
MVYNAYKGVIYNTDFLKNTNKLCQYGKRKKYYQEAFHYLFFQKIIIYAILSLAKVPEIRLFWGENFQGGGGGMSVSEQNIDPFLTNLSPIC